MFLRFNAGVLVALLVISAFARAESTADPESDTSVRERSMGAPAASRLLARATFGPTLESIAATATQSDDAWFDAQAALAPSLTLPAVKDDHTNFYEVWLTNAVMGKDQLRQRVAFALSEILVISNNGGPLIFQNRSLAAYYDILIKNALGNYRTLLEEVTLSPAMGQYLSVLRNDKPNPRANIHADENYAREVMQLFTIGLDRLNPDGSVVTGPSGKPIATFTQTDVEQLARVLTGWGSNPNKHPMGEQSWEYDIDYLHPMIAYSTHHDTHAKTIVGGTTIPAGGTAASDLKTALDALCGHPNVGPFIGKQLIQRLVTSNPSRAYVARVAATFNDNGHGIRGDLLAVVKAILTDPEASTAGSWGKLREPLIRLTGLWRAFDGADSTGKLSEYLVIQNSERSFGQAPLQAPSVFNFFRPDYEREIRPANTSLTAPELQITNENTLVLLSEQLTWQAYAFIDSRGNKHAGYQGYMEPNNIGDRTVLLHTARWEPYAHPPATLVDQLNLVFMQGEMPPGMRARLIQYVSGIPMDAPWDRVAEAAELIVNSPQYAVQR